MNSYIFIQISDCSKSNIIDKCRYGGINLFSIRSDGKTNIIKIDLKDYEKFQQYFKIVNYKPLLVNGPKYIFFVIRNYLSWIIFSLLTIILLFFLSNFIVDVNIDLSDRDLAKKVLVQLEKNGISKFTYKKNYNEIANIKEKIKQELNDDLEWIEITTKGMTYEVKMEKRIKNKSKKENDYCFVYAKKDGMIVGAQIYAGDFIVDYNDYVKKGDALVSGDIIFNEQVVDHVCAKADVFAEVWYQIKVKIPFDYYETVKGKKYRYNFVLNYNDIDYPLFKDRLKNYESTTIKIFDALGIKIYLKKDIEVKKIKHKYNEEEAIQKAIALAKEKVALKLTKEDKIIKEKVLQKKINNSTMNVDIFIIAKEQIGESIALKED